MDKVRKDLEALIGKQAAAAALASKPADLKAQQEGWF